MHCLLFILGVLRQIEIEYRDRSEVCDLFRAMGEMVPPERVELSSPAPEAGTLSTELQGQLKIKNSMVAFRSTT